MDAIITALNASLPAFFLIIVGSLSDYWLTKLDLTTLARLSVYILIPALVFNALIGTSLTLSDASWLALAYVLYLLGVAAVAAGLSRSLDTTQTRGVIATSLFGNTGNMGLPITFFAYGQAGLERAVVILVVSLILMFALGAPLLSGSKANLWQRFKAALWLPPIWGTVIGVIWNVTASTFSWQLPISVIESVRLLAGAAIPVMLLSLGVQMRRSWVWGIGPAALRATLARLLSGPLIAYGVARLLALPQLDTSVLVLSAAMPAAVTMFVLAVEVKGDAEGVGRSVVATTVGSVFVITAVLFLFPNS